MVTTSTHVNLRKMSLKTVFYSSFSDGSAAKTGQARNRSRFLSREPMSQKVMTHSKLHSTEYREQRIYTTPSPKTELISPRSLEFARVMHQMLNCTFSRRTKAGFGCIQK